MAHAIQGNWSYSSFAWEIVVSQTYSGDVSNGLRDKLEGRMRCDYCGQQNTIESFDGGCRNCGAPSPKEDTE